MDVLGIHHAAVAGHPMGSIIAQQLALDYPDRIDAAVLVSTSGRVKANAVLTDYVLKEPIQGTWETALDAKGIRSPAQVWAASPADADPDVRTWLATFWDVDPSVDPALVGQIVETTSKVRLGTWIGATEALLQYDNLEALRNMKTPLVVWAIQDAISPSRTKGNLPRRCAPNLSDKDRFQAVRSDAASGIGRAK